MFSFLPLINNSLGLMFLLQSITVIISSNTINILFFYLDCIFQSFYKYQSLNRFKSQFSRLLIDN